MGIRVIINADDFGYSPMVNTRIAECIASRRISSCTILANSDYWSDVHEIINRFPHISYGIHLNLTEGRPLSDRVALAGAGLLDESGCFNGLSIRNITPTRAVRVAVYNELDSQIRKVICEESVKVSHVDGHHHVHNIPWVLDIVRALISKYGIRKIRRDYVYPVNFALLDYTKTSDSLPARFSKSIKRYCRWLLALLSAGMVHMRRPYAGCSTTDYFMPYEYACEACNRGAYFPQNSVVELMCHPGHPKYENEYVRVVNGDFSLLVKKAEMVNYNDL